MNRRHTFILGFVVLIGLAVLWFSGLREQLELSRLLESLRAHRDSPLAIAIYVTAYFVGTCLLLPATAFHIAAGAVWGFWPGCAIAYLGENVCANLHFGLGRLLGAQRVRAWLERRGWLGVIDELENRGVVAMLIVRQFPLPFLGVNVGAGVSPMTWPQFVVGNAVGVLPMVLTYTYFAAALTDGVEGARTQALIRAGIAGVVIIGIGLVSRWLMRRRSGAVAQPRNI